MCAAQNHLRQVPRRARRWQVRFGTLVSPVSRGRSRAATRRLAAPRGRARRGLPASASREPSRLSGKLSSQARYSSCSAISVASCCPTAGPRRQAPGRRRGWRAAVPTQPGAMSPAARPQSAVMLGGEAWAWRAPLVIRDCHVSRADRRADLVGFVFGFWACSLCGAGTAVLRPGRLLRDDGQPGGPFSKPLRRLTRCE